MDGGGVPGDGIVDGFSVTTPTGDVAFVPTTLVPGTTTIDGRTFHYAGMDPFSPDGGDASHRMITGSVGNDNITLEDNDPNVERRQTARHLHERVVLRRAHHLQQLRDRQPDSLRN